MGVPGIAPTRSRSFRRYPGRIQAQGGKAKTGFGVAGCVPALRWGVTVVLVVALGGCLSEILPGPPVSTLDFTCAVLDVRGVERVRIQSHGGQDSLGFTASADSDSAGARAVALATLASQIAQLAERELSQISVVEQGLPEALEGDWNASTLMEWAQDEAFRARNEVILYVLWFPALADATALGLIPAPATVALSEGAIQLAAARLNRTTEEVARAVLLHFAGHALGVTNRGIPVQDPELQVREGTPGHDADPASVMTDGWEDARTASWAANATYDRYPDAAHADWQGARGPGGVCT